MPNLEPSLELVAVVNDEQCVVVAKLARQIWPEHYLSIIGQAQVDYMLVRFQSEQAIAAQIAMGDEYFLLRHGDEWLGYAAVRNEPDAGRLFVSKLYLLKEARGQGIGRASLEYLARLARQRGLHKLWLTVNKYNPAVLAYLRIGFVKVNDVITDIGDGYVMDDFQLEWMPALS